MTTIVNNPTRLITFSFFGVLVIIYFLSPIDLIPDYLGLIGYLDDIFVVGFFIYGIVRTFYSNFIERNELEFNVILAQ